MFRFFFRQKKPTLFQYLRAQFLCQFPPTDGVFCGQLVVDAGVLGLYGGQPAPDGLLEHVAEHRALAGLPAGVLPGQLGRPDPGAKNVDVFPKLGNGVSRKVEAEGQAADLVVDEAADYLDLHYIRVRRSHLHQEAVGALEYKQQKLNFSIFIFSLVHLIL